MRAADGRMHGFEHSCGCARFTVAAGLVGADRTRLLVGTGARASAEGEDLRPYDTLDPGDFRDAPGMPGVQVHTMELAVPCGDCSTSVLPVS